MMNIALVIGRITKDIELQTTSGGKYVCKFTVACNRDIVPTGSEKTADFLNCVVWGKTAENLGRYCGKGSLVAVKGRIQERSYENKNGQKVYITEIACESVQFLDNKKKEPQPNTGYHPQQYDDFNQNADFANYAGQTVDINPDDLPF